MEEKGPVQALDRAFDVMETLCGARDGLALHELTAATGLHKSTVHRMLQALVHRGYATQDEDTGRYRMTTRLYALSGQVVENLDLVQVARRPMEELSRRVEETVHLLVPEGSEIVYVHKVEADAPGIRMFSRIGMHRPMYCTGGGKAMLACMSDEDVSRIWNESQIQSYTPRTILTLDALKAELELVRARGVALDDEENELGVRCIAAPVRDYSGQVCAALSISAPLTRMSDERLASLRPVLLETRDLIAHGMGWTGA